MRFPQKIKLLDIFKRRFILKTNNNIKQEFLNIRKIVNCSFFFRSIGNQKRQSKIDIMNSFKVHQPNNSIHVVISCQVNYYDTKNILFPYSVVLIITIFDSLIKEKSEE